MSKYKTRAIHKYSKEPLYEVLVSARQGGGWFPLSLANGQPARFNRPPRSLAEANFFIKSGTPKMSNYKSDLCDIDVQLHHETELSWLVSSDGERENAVWIPKKLAELEPEGKHYVLTLPEWLATEKKLDI